MTTVPLDPSREQARSWAVEELSKREYTARAPGLVDRALNWLIDRISGIALPDGTGSALLFGVLLAVLAVLVTVAVVRWGGLRRNARVRREAPVMAGTPVRTAAEHRATAAVHADAGRWREATLERFRAVARELEEGAVLSPSPGRTAGELAADAGRQVPELAARIAAAAAAFDEARYGEHEVGPEQEAAVGQVDDLVRERRPVLR